MAKKPKPTELAVVENIKVAIDASCADKSRVHYEADFAYLDADKRAKDYIDQVLKAIEESQ